MTSARANWLADSEPDWTALVSAAAAWHQDDAMTGGLELRHLRRLLQPVVERMWRGEPLVARLADLRPGEDAAGRAAHRALACACTCRALGLPRAAAADTSVAALVVEAGVPHLLARAAWSPLARLALSARADRPRTSSAPQPLVAQLVGVADGYVALLSGDTAPRPTPVEALAQVLDVPGARAHPAIRDALVRALGTFPPGQLVRIDDGSLARALAPAADDPDRPWVERLRDEHGRPLPDWARVPTRRRVALALAWSEREEQERERERPAA